MVERVWEYYLEECPKCGGELELVQPDRDVKHQVELKKVLVSVQEHRRWRQKCHQCGQEHLPRWPEELVRAGLAGPRLTAWIAWLKTACHLSYTGIQRLLSDCAGLKLSRGYLAKIVQKVSDCLASPYQEMLDRVAMQSQVNVDETGHKENGDRYWTWCFRTPEYTAFKISPSRSSKVLVEVLGPDFQGVLSCDYFSAYRKYIKEFDKKAQFCLAHFVRDVKFLADHPHQANRRHGQRLLASLRKLFHVIHRRKEFASEATFRRRLTAIRNQLVYDAIMESPGTREADNLADRFASHYESFFTFITNPDIEPTNNAAERAIRPIAIHRRVTQGTRSARGRTCWERLWSVIATCERQGRSAFHYLTEAVSKAYAGVPVPSLVTPYDTS